MSRDRGEAANEQREREMAFSEVLRQKAKSGRPTIEDLRDRGAEGKDNDEK